MLRFIPSFFCLQKDPNMSDYFRPVSPEYDLEQAKAADLKFYADLRAVDAFAWLIPLSEGIIEALVKAGNLEGEDDANGYSQLLLPRKEDDGSTTMVIAGKVAPDGQMYPFMFLQRGKRAESYRPPPVPLAQPDVRRELVNHIQAWKDAAGEEHALVQAVLPTFIFDYFNKLGGKVSSYHLAPGHIDVSGKFPMFAFLLTEDGVEYVYEVTFSMDVLTTKKH